MLKDQFVSVKDLNNHLEIGELHVGCDGEVYHIFVNGVWRYTGDWINDKPYLLNGGVVRTNKKIKLN